MSELLMDVVVRAREFSARDLARLLEELGFELDGRDLHDAAARCRDAAASIEQALGLPFGRVS